ncbi:MAG: hypothetical protein VCA36_05130, partial [Opitutales bacterium]
MTNYSQDCIIQGITNLKNLLTTSESHILSLSSSGLEPRLEQAAQAVRDADALYIGAGAGMGVDSGLPDFRGKEGFWKAYPP